MTQKIMQKMSEKVFCLIANRKGQGLVEYGMIIALIAVVAIASLTTVGQNIMAKLNAAAAAIGN